MTRLAAHQHPEIARPSGVDPNAVLSVFRVPKEMAGMRADVFMATQLKNTSRTRAKVIIQAAAYYVDGTRVKPNDRLAAEVLVSLWRPPWDEQPLDVDIPILLHDDHIIVINKPAGIPVHPSARYYRNTIIKLLAESFPSEHLVLAHRLDRDTSGVLVLARTFHADRRIKRQFCSKTGVDKSYLAICWGCPEQSHFRVDLPIERNPDSTLRCSMRVAAPGNGLPAATRVTVLQKHQRDSKRYALLQCDLETGRQHQIRLHLAASGFPIVGDKIYGPDEQLHARAADDLLTEQDRKSLEMPRHALHARQLAFEHPITGEKLVITAPLPADMQSFLDSLSLVNKLHGTE